VLVAAPVQHGAVGRGGDAGRQKACHRTAIVITIARLLRQVDVDEVVVVMCIHRSRGQLDEVSDEDLAKQKLSTT
jgi:hypothetical protein